MKPRTETKMLLGMIETMRDQGWCVVLKCLPKDVAWIIEGSRSEYDAPCPDRSVAPNTWCCEAQWMKHDSYKPTCTALKETAFEAVKTVFIEACP